MVKRGVLLGPILACLCLPPALLAQAYDGLTLYNTMNSRTTKLIDNSGQTVNSWYCNSNVAYVPYLMPDSTMWRPGVYSGASMRGAAYGGLVEQYDWDGNVIESFIWSNSYHQQHHDIQPMPNGHVLVVSWDRKTRTEAQAMGRVNINGDFWPDEIVEYDPVGDSVVWEWHAWDHLIQDVDPLKPNYGVVREHPELLDINLGYAGMGGDWMHVNAVDYNEERDEIVFCSHNLHELYVIDHSTTVEEAAGHTGGRHGKGGDFLYRWGNPQNYDRGSSADQHFFVVHGVNWIRPGLQGADNILIFNNGNRPGTGSDYSSAEEIVPPRDTNGFFIIDPDSAYGPAAPFWMYSNPGAFYSEHLGGAYRLPNGNTFTVEGTRGRFTEVTSSGTVVWQYNVGSQIGRASKHPRDFTSVEETTVLPVCGCGLEPAVPNPFTRSTLLNYQLPEQARVRLTVHDVTGRTVATLVNGYQNAGRHQVRFAPETGVAVGTYFVRLTVRAEDGSMATETTKLLQTK